MPYLNFIVHSHETTQVKVRYFCDYFKLCNNRLGILPEMEFENPLSLIQKCIFQLEYNSSKSNVYLANYFGNSLLDPEGFIKRFVQFNNVHILIKEFLTIPVKKRSRWIINNTELTEAFKNLYEELEMRMHDELISSLTSFLRCSHKLNKHRDDIEFCARMFITEFRLRGHTQNEISEVISKIMSDDITKFPFPPEVTDKKDELNYKELLQSFLNERTFNKQFEGIKNQLNINYYDWTIFYRIQNITTKEFKNFELEYDKVIFLSPYHKKLQKLKKYVKSRKLLNDFFSKQINFLIVTCQVRSHSIEAAKIIADEEINKAIPILNKVCVNTPILDDSYYLSSDNWETAEITKGPKQKLTKFKPKFIEKLSDNPFTFLSECTSDSKSTILFYESKHREAQKKKDISILWEYLENIIPLNNEGRKQVKEIASNILTFDFRYRIKNDLRFNFLNMTSPFSASSEELGISSERQYELEGNYNTLNLRKLKSEFSRPIIKRTISLYEKHASKKNLESIKQYYYRILTEVFEQRNFIVHSDKLNEKHLIKLKAIFPKLVYHLRNTILHEILEKPDLSYNQIITDLNKKASILIKNET